jgi:hypothetical protein
MTDFQPKSPQEELIRAGQANEILNSALFIEMRQTIETQLAANRRAAPIRDTDLHTRLILTEQLWGNILDWFKQTAQTGRMAEVQIQQERSMKERFLRR